MRRRKRRLTRRQRRFRQKKRKRDTNLLKTRDLCFTLFKELKNFNFTAEIECPNNNFDKGAERKKINSWAARRRRRKKRGRAKIKERLERFREANKILLFAERKKLPRPRKRFILRD
jgi:hypothetical protein